MQYENGSRFDAVYPRAYSPRMSIGDRLDKAMQDANIESQSELARKSGVPQATISRILKGGGKKGPETETIRRLAAACGVTFEYLNEGDRRAGGALVPVNIPKPANDEHVTADEILELISAYKDSEPKDRKWIMDSAKTAAARANRRRERITNEL